MIGFNESLAILGDQVQYDDNWDKLPYFITSRETAFEMILLKRFEVELLLG